MENKTKKDVLKNLEEWAKYGISESCGSSDSKLELQKIDDGIKILNEKEVEEVTVYLVYKEYFDIEDMACDFVGVFSTKQKAEKYKLKLEDEYVRGFKFYIKESRMDKELD